MTAATRGIEERNGHSNTYQMMSANLSDRDGEIGTVLEYQSDWSEWFAWRPVRLYMTGRLAWLRPIHRRSVVKYGLTTWDFTDQPEAFATPAPVE
jgi:hypothetical protein